MSESDRWSAAWEEECVAHAATRAELEVWKDRFHKAVDVVILLAVIVVVMVILVAAGDGR